MYQEVNAFFNEQADSKLTAHNKRLFREELNRIYTSSPSQVASAKPTPSHIDRPADYEFEESGPVLSDYRQSKAFKTLLRR